MNLLSYRTIGAAFLFAAVCTLSSTALGQSQPGLSGDIGRRSMRVAERNNVYCAGYVTSSAVSTDQRIVGGWNEQDGWHYSQSNHVYLNVGPESGVKVGDVLAVVRPKGQVKTKWSSKGKLGMYVQEVGMVEVVRVKGDHAVAKVQTSCDSFLLGDLVRPVENREAPIYTQRPALDVFAEPSGKATGRLFMARDNKEVVARENIVYVDLGEEDKVRVGDYLTVFRPLGKGNLMKKSPNEAVPAASSGYASDEYGGAQFSSQSGRVSGKDASGRVVSSERAKDGRPKLRKVVGELVVLNVKERVATAVVVRNAQEIHTGDWVEVQ